MKRTVLSLLIAFSTTCLQAQTQPTPQPVPYITSFADLTPTSTTYPPGWQGWTLSGSPSGNYNTAPPASDKALTTGSASSTANGVYNYGSKLGFLNSGTVDNCVVLALNTTGKVNISFGYEVGTLRNPYDGNSNTRINEVTLQYRIGTSGDFTTLTDAGLTYQNNTTQQTGSGVTSPQNPETHLGTLPPACDNQPVVQLRWVNRQISGAGSRPSFVLSDVRFISQGADNQPPSIANVQPLGTDVSPASPLIATFSENIQAGRDSTFLVVHNTTDGINTAFPANSPNITISSTQLTLNYQLQPHKTYYVTIDSGMIQDLSGNNFAGLFNTDTWRFSTGDQQLSFDFNNCTGTGLSGGFTQYSVRGAQVWACTTFGQNNTNGVQINGFNNGPVDNEDWLISPSLDLTGFDFPLLHFASRTAFAGPSLQLLVSTDYTGGDPSGSTWTPVNGRFPALSSDAWKTSDSINLAAFKHNNVHIAFVYTSSPALNAARWTIDDFGISNSPVAPPPSLDLSANTLDFDYVASGQNSSALPLSFIANDFSGPLNITASSGFQVSTDSAGVYSNSISTSRDTIWVRFKPTAANQSYSGQLRLDTLGNVALSGTSLRSLKVVNWNIEWFGSPAQDPANDSLQQANVTTVLKKLDADIFALAEVVDTARFRAVVNQLPGYSYVLSDYGSYADSITDVDYTSAQKLAFVYKTAIFRKLRTYGVLRRGGSSDAYYNWSSGRFPFFMEAEANLNGDSARLNFVLLHAKANTGTAAEKLEGWQRRKNGNIELKDSLDTQYPHANFIILGDFNDALDKTITTERAPDTTTSYIDFMNDTLHYKPLTLPLSLAGKQSTASFATVIDNVIASDEMGLSYLPGSARVRTDVTTLVNNYSSTTTDHYPVQTNYNLQVLANPAPVDNFSARVDTGNVRLSWHTDYEINTHAFVIERSRNQQQGYETVDTIAAQGHAADYVTYDRSPWFGLSYYRLKTLFADGGYHYSAPQRVSIDLADLLAKLLWCLIGHQLQIWIDMHQPGPAQVQLIDLQGRIRYQTQYILNKGRNLKNLDVHTLPNGIYVLKIQSLEGTQTTKILVNQ